MPLTYEELFLLIRALYEDRLDRRLETFMFPPFINLPDLRQICSEETELLGSEYQNAFFGGLFALEEAENADGYYRNIWLAYIRNSVAENLVATA